MPLVEVRVPTYRRPELLERALRSLLVQSQCDWRAIVMDDSPAQEAREVVARLGDSRVEYAPNLENRGRAGNIDLAFQSRGVCGGRYAFVLEDDNYLLPGFIDSNIAALNAESTAILLRNQEMCVEEKGLSKPVGATTRGDWMKDGIIDAIDLYAQLFFHTGISNGGLFWDTERVRTNFQVGAAIQHSSFQEMMRTLRLSEPVAFRSEPLCVYTLFAERSDAVVASHHANREFSRAQQSIYRFLLGRLGARVVEHAMRLAVTPERRRRLEAVLLDSLYTTGVRIEQFTAPERVRTLFKSWLRLVLYRDPFRSYFATETDLLRGATGR